MSTTHDSLEHFHPVIQAWFRGCFGAPVDAQAQAWPVIAAGRHVLVTAPTGSGKTLTAFLWAINQLVTGAWPAGSTRVLYISPLKALNNDVRINLLQPLGELRGRFDEAGIAFPDINVLTRSGDTPPDERRRMARRPPEILITTPESLNILLSSKSGRAGLTGIASVILDEIHAIAGTKRGTHLITAVERLVPLSGEFQRIALSATVRPVETVAGFVGGFIQHGSGAGCGYEARPVTIIRAGGGRQYRLSVTFPENAREQMADNSWWPALIESFRHVIDESRSTLFFTNSRRTAERVARLLNENADETIAYSHHGSLSREIRLAVEQKLKSGEIRAIVATSSLELGIDIGDLDRVALIQTPFSAASAIQRIGRSGHGVGQASTGIIYPTHGMDFLTAAVLARCVVTGDIDELRPVECPLDVLAQVILSMTCVEEWDIDRLYEHLRTCYPYHNLPRRQFDLVLAMLAGRYADTRVRELVPRISIDTIDNTVRSRNGAPRLLFMSGGTIPDRGYYDLRVHNSHAKIGELDEEFVWERRVGETFAFGPQAWRIQRITHNEVEVVPAGNAPGIIPFWRAENQDRDFHFAEAVARFLENADPGIDDENFAATLCTSYYMDAPAADELTSFLRRQKDATKSPLPHRHHLLVEHFDDPLNTSDSKQVILHTMWGGRVNRPFALALASAWEQAYHYRPETIVNNESILLILPHGFSAADIFSMVSAGNIEALLRKSLESTGFFGAHFRENAGRALLLPRASFNKRLPLWFNRLRAKKLMQAVLSYEDFPILLETWRECLRDEFDLEHCRLLLDEIRAGVITVTETTTTTASPFAGGLVWQQANTYMYADDTPSSRTGSMLNEELIKEIAASSRLRPRISPESVRQLERKLQRTEEGYAPQNSRELLDFLKERLLVPEHEWNDLRTAMERDGAVAPDAAIAETAGKIVTLTLPGASHQAIAAVETLPRLAAALGIRDVAVAQAANPPDVTDTLSVRPLITDALSHEALRANLAAVFRVSPDDNSFDSDNGTTDFIAQFLSYYGPSGITNITQLLGIGEAALNDALAILAEKQAIVIDRITADACELEVCDLGNLEILLRMARSERRPTCTALPIERLPLFMAAWQGLAEKGGDVEDMQNRLDQLFGCPAAASAWEEHIFPARLEPYYTEWLDSLMLSSGLSWFGCGARKIFFAFPEDAGLFAERAQNGDSGAESLLPDTAGRYGFFDIVKHSGLGTAEATRRLWRAVWDGRIAGDTFGALRRGMLNNFAPFSPNEGVPAGARSRYNRWTASRPLHGNWYAVTPGGAALNENGEFDILEMEEVARDRVRQLFRRYGILFRELLVTELPPLQWGRIFRALRLMELSGEILTGRFFEGVPGVQFISHEAFRFLGRPLPSESVYWMNATDPASLCGIQIEGLKASLPTRIASNHIVYCGDAPVLISRRNGKALEFRTTPEDPRIPEYLTIFRDLLSRRFNPPRAILVETINGADAARSGYAAPMKSFGFIAQFRRLELWKKF